MIHVLCLRFCTICVGCFCVFFVLFCCCCFLGGGGGGWRVGFFKECFETFKYLALSVLEFVLMNCI